ncbi:MAG: hypothetical protein JWL70_2067 [Acidimicrobiia bacterium]|nr:hypothetical protein [Acidimicrobiia bacterium]
MEQQGASQSSHGQGVHVLTDEEAARLLDWTKVPDHEPRAPELLRVCTQMWPDNQVLVFNDESITYGDLNEQSARLARQLLARGVSKGTRVGMIFPNDPRFIVTFFALLRIGAVAVPISTFSAPGEIRRIVRHADLTMLISTDGLLNIDYVQRYVEAFPSLSQQQAPYRMPEAPFLRSIAIWADVVPEWAERFEVVGSDDIDDAFLAEVESEVRPADVACIIYTSGSTSEPKGVIHTHGSLFRQARKIAAHYPFKEDDRVYTPMPLFWVGGLELNLLQLMQVGGALLGSSDSSPGGLLQMITVQRPTVVVAWAHTVKAIMGYPGLGDYDLSSMRSGLLFDALRGHRQGVLGFGEALGMTEAGGPHTISLFEQTPGFEMSYGKPMPGMELKIVDPVSGATAPDGQTGVLMLRGDVMMQGLVKRERQDTFDPDGWYTTGDLCSFVDNFLFFHGRADDLIKTAGSNVSPGEVQAALRGFPGVGQAHVSAVADPARGAVVGVVIVPEPGSHIDLDKLREFARQNLSAYKVPRVIVVMEAIDLPMMSSGKVDRIKLISLLHEAHAAQG